MVGRKGPFESECLFAIPELEPNEGCRIGVSSSRWYTLNLVIAKGAYRIPTRIYPAHLQMGFRQRQTLFFLRTDFGSTQGSLDLVSWIPRSAKCWKTQNVDLLRRELLQQDFLLVVYKIKKSVSPNVKIRRRHSIEADSTGFSARTGCTML